MREGAASDCDPGKIAATGALRSWSNDTAGVHFCRWAGVNCSAAGRVTELDVSKRRLTGTLSPAVAGLRALTGLYLHYNALRGGVPRELARLTWLTDVYLVEIVG